MSSLAAVVPVAESVDTLLAGASAREPIVGGAGKSGARLERVMIDGQRYVVKYLHLADDWTMRAAGDLSGAAFTAWRRGLLARLPDCINQPIVGVCKDPGGSAVLMRDVSQWLVPVTDEVIPLEQHLRFLDHMAAMHAAFWDAGQEVEVIPVMHRYLELSVWIAEAEATIGSTHLVPRLIGQGWALLGDVAPRAAAVAVPLSVDPGPLVEALWRTPQTFVHGNWKLDNLGTDADGRTVLLDWELPGRGAALSDLAWYLAINCRRLPQTKEEAIDAYRGALERHGVDTAPWWDTQLALCLLGALVQFGWEKAFGGYDDELAWWEARAIEGARLLS
jgi:Phosphotransferase enzyme family